MKINWTNFVIVVFIIVAIFSIVTLGRFIFDKSRPMLEEHYEELEEYLESEEDTTIQKLDDAIDKLDASIEELQELLGVLRIQEANKRATVSAQVSRGSTRKFEATAYDNTPASQGKWVNQTATGFNLAGHTLESARCIAVDPAVIPLHSKVYVEFPEAYKHLDGIYTAYDTGGAIKGRRIDVFFGDGDVRSEAMAFGRRSVNVTILE